MSSSDASVGKASAMEPPDQAQVDIRKREEHKNKSKRRGDPVFDKLREAALDTAYVKSPSSPDPWYMKIVYAPLMALSFILSLTFISRQDRERRAAEHEHVLGLRSRGSWVTWKPWTSPEPYQQFKHGAETVSQDPDKSTWVIRKNKMALGKMQLEEAMNLHGSMMLLIIFGILFSGTAIYYLGRWAWALWTRT